MKMISSTPDRELKDDLEERERNRHKPNVKYYTAFVVCDLSLLVLSSIFVHVANLHGWKIIHNMSVSFFWISLVLIPVSLGVLAYIYSPDKNNSKQEIPSLPHRTSSPFASRHGRKNAQDVIYRLLEGELHKGNVPTDYGACGSRSSLCDAQNVRSAILQDYVMCFGQRYNEEGSGAKMKSGKSKNASFPAHDGKLREMAKLDDIAGKGAEAGGAAEILYSDSGDSGFTVLEDPETKTVDSSDTLGEERIDPWIRRMEFYGSWESSTETKDVSRGKMSQSGRYVYKKSSTKRLVVDRSSNNPKETRDEV